MTREVLTCHGYIFCADDVVKVALIRFRRLQLSATLATGDEWQLIRILLRAACPGNVRPRRAMHAQETRGGEVFEVHAFLSSYSRQCRGQHTIQCIQLVMPLFFHSISKPNHLSNRLLDKRRVDITNFLIISELWGWCVTWLINSPIWQAGLQYQLIREIQLISNLHFYNALVAIET